MGLILSRVLEGEAARWGMEEGSGSLSSMWIWGVASGAWVLALQDYMQIISGFRATASGLGGYCGKRFLWEGLALFMCMISGGWDRQP